MKAALRVVCILISALAATFALAILVEPGVRGHKTPGSQARSPLEEATPFLARGIEQPVVIPATLAKLSDEVEVIGVSAGGKARAYVVSAFDGPEAHVVNDLLAGRPITVTHCDRTNCTRVFTATSGDKPLPIACAGWHGAGLLLSVPGGIYAQDGAALFVNGAPPFPYPEIPFAKTSWGDWRRAHPDSDVYLGEESAASALEQGSATRRNLQQD